MSSDNMTTSAGVSALEVKLSWASRHLALVGGYIMVALAMMTVISIIGRAFFTSPINGDYEMVELGLAISVFFFLPECHRQKGHVVVDFFTIKASKTTLLILSTVSEVLFFMFSILFVWRLSIGTYEAWEYSEQTMILGLPYWVAYSCGILSMLLITANSIVQIRSDINGLTK